MEMVKSVVKALKKAQERQLQLSWTYVMKWEVDRVTTKTLDLLPRAEGSEEGRKRPMERGRTGMSGS